MIPEKFGRYEVMAEVGDGAMGRVYSAWDPAVGRVVAIKTVKRELLTSETSAEFLRRFRNEAIAVGALSHPAIVAVYDVGEDYIVMEYVEGRTLQSILRERGRLPPGEAQGLLAPVADAIDFAHRRNIVHRDIKPANVMVQTDGQPKLMDFGVAKVETSVMTATGQILGSPSYMAPEQIAGQTVTGRSDVYSLAVVAYEMLTGQPPFQGKTITSVIYQVMHDQAPPPRQWNAALPHRYDDVFAKALQKDPTLRYETGGAFVAALDLREMEHTLSPEPWAEVETEKIALTEEQADAVARSRSDGTGPTRRRPRWPLVAGLALVVALAGVWVVVRGRTVAVVPPAPEVTTTPEATVPEPTPSATAATSSAQEPSPAATAAAVSPSPAPHRTHEPKPPLAHAGPSPTSKPTPAPVVEGQLVQMGPGVTPPRKVEGPSASYPDEARRRKLQGTVGISLIIDENGVPQDMKVVESAGPVLDEAVLKAVEQWRFEPARKDGVRVKIRWLVRQTYRRAR
jgi:TonB family protein